MKIDGGAVEFFQSIPDDLLAEIALHDREALVRLCLALSLALQLLVEEAERMRKLKKRKKSLAS